MQSNKIAYIVICLLLLVLATQIYAETSKNQGDSVSFVAYELPDSINIPTHHSSIVIDPKFDISQIIAWIFAILSMIFGGKYLKYIGLIKEILKDANGILQEIQKALNDNRITAKEIRKIEKLFKDKLAKYKKFIPSK